MGKAYTEMNRYFGNGYMRRVISVDVEYLKETDINLRQEIIIWGL